MIGDKPTNIDPVQKLRAALHDKPPRHLSTLLIMARKTAKKQAKYSMCNKRKKSADKSRLSMLRRRISPFRQNTPTAQVRGRAGGQGSAAGFVR